MKNSLLVFSLLSFILMQPTQAQNPVLLGDVNATPRIPSYLPYTFGNSNGGFYFFAYDNNGTGLYRSDGAPQGTYLVRPLSAYSGFEGSQFTIVDSTVFFTHNTDPLESNCSLNKGPCDQELWKTDGTQQGTVVVKDIYPGYNSSNPYNLINFKGKLFFSAYTPEDGVELWKSDGTESGTVMVKDINPGAFGSYPGPQAILNNHLIFAATSGSSGVEPWITNGTASGTHLITEINLNPNGSSNPSHLTTFNNAVYFSATDGGSIGYALWKTDGTAAGTILVKDFSSSVGGISDIKIANGKLLIVALDDTHGYELWSSDGTVAGTLFVKDIYPGASSSSISQLTSIGSVAYFCANDSVHGIEPWVTDGTSAGTHMIADLNWGTTSSMVSDAKIFQLGTNALFYAIVNNIPSLYKTDGTEAGTVKFFSNPSFASIPLEGVYNNQFYFFNFGLWVSDGTVTGTHPFEFNITQTWSSITNQGYPGTIGKLPNHQYIFIASDTSGREQPWITNGTPETTHIIKDFESQVWCTLINSVNGRFFFTVSSGDSSNGTWITDGTLSGTSKISDVLAQVPTDDYREFSVVLNSILYFVSTQTAELWRSDGTTGGTYRIKDINPSGNEEVGSWGGLIVFNGQVYFTADDGIHGTDLWKSDGTEAGTVLVKDIPDGSSGYHPAHFIVFNGKLFYTTDDGSHGIEPWVSDGTTDGTIMLKNISSGQSSSYPTFEISGNNLFIIASTSSIYKLWKTDGTTAGTVVLKEFSLGGCSSSVSFSGFKDVNGVLYMGASDAAHGVELWKSDGTVTGTVLVKDIYPGSCGSFPNNLTNVNGELYFTATDSVKGNQVWKSDGTNAGTQMVSDFPLWSNMYSFTNVNGILYFIYCGDYWRTDGTLCRTQHLDFIPGTADQVATLLIDSNLIFFTMMKPEIGFEPWELEPFPIPISEVCNGFDDDCNGIVDNNPMVSISPAGTLEVCRNNMITFSTDEGINVSYQWNKNGNAIAGATKSSFTSSKTEHGNYTVTVNGTDCIATSEATVLNRLDQPDATITTLGNPDICPTGSVDLQANSGAGLSYQWQKKASDIAGASNQIYSATKKGSYKVVVKNSADCSKISRATKVTNSCKLADVNEEDFQFTIYPNPASYNLTLQFNSDPASPVQILITDILGRVVFSSEKPLDGNSILLQLDEKFPNGMYLLTIHSSQGSFQKIFEVQK